MVMDLFTCISDDRDDVAITLILFSPWFPCLYFHLVVMCTFNKSPQLSSGIRQNMKITFENKTDEITIQVSGQYS